VGSGALGTGYLDSDSGSNDYSNLELGTWDLELPTLQTSDQGANTNAAGRAARDFRDSGLIIKTSC